MSDVIDAYSEEQFKAARTWLLKELLVDPKIAPALPPRAVLLGGQSGAGKTTLHGILKAELGGNAVVVNGDEYRKAHPHFRAIQDAYGVDAPAHTAAWAGAMVEALVDALSRGRYNLVVEGTLRTSSVPLGTASLLKGRGYDVSLALMAVKPEISLLSCQIRYELMRLAGTTPRATDPAHHDKIVHDIVENLEVLEESGAFSEIRLFDRAGTCLYPAGDVGESAHGVLQRVLFGPWTDIELQHAERLRAQLAELQGA